MTTHGPPPPRVAPIDSSGSRKVETQEAQTKGRRRGHRGSGTVGRIQTTARERQDAWLETGRPNDTYRLTRELDGLYDEHRDEAAGTLTDPYYGRTMKAGQ